MPGYFVEFTKYVPNIKICSWDIVVLWSLWYFDIWLENYWQNFSKKWFHNFRVPVPSQKVGIIYWPNYFKLLLLVPLANTLPFLGKNNFSSSILTFNLYKLKYKYIPWSHKNHVFRTLCAHSKSEKWKKCGGDQKGYSKHEPINFTKKTSHFTITTYYYLHSTAKFFFFLFFEDALLFVILLYFSWEHNLECICTTCYNTKKNLCFHQVFSFCLFKSIF